jgi:phosphatidylinositol glycan class S
MYGSSNTSLSETFRHSSRAHTLSSRAFFNPGMLALLYFPAEHKYAVYTPLFASAVIPLVVAALRELKAWRKQRKERMVSAQKPPQKTA